MTTYTVLPQDDENLNVIVTSTDTDEIVVIDTTLGVTVTDTDTVKIDITPALIPPYGGFPVSSVNTKTGYVVLNTDDVQEDASPTNKYFSDALARSSISATGDIAYDSATGIISFNAAGNLVVSVNGASGSVTLDTDDIPEGSAKYYSSSLFDASFAAKTTNYLSEGGTNKYFTDARVQTVIDTNSAEFITKNSTEILTNKSGNNSQWTNDEAYIKADSTDTLTNKSGSNLQWTNDAGYITHQTDSQLLSFSTPNLSISSGNTVDISNLASSLDTDDIAEGTTNLYYTDTRARNSISVTNASGDGSLAYNATTGTITYTGPSAAEVHAHFSAVDTGGDGSFAYANGVFTYTGPSSAEVWAHFSGGTGVDITSGVVSIGQPVATTDSVTFNTVTANLTGDVTGNLTGNSAGVHTGNVTGDVTGTVSDISNHSTTDLTEGTNLYYTDVRVAAKVTKAFVDALGIQATSVTPNSVALGTDTTGNYVATITGTANEIAVLNSGTETAAVTIGLPTDVVIAGDLTVNGTTTTINTTNLLIEDNIFELNHNIGPAVTPTKDAGMIINRGSQDNAALVWDEAGTSGKFTLGTTTADGTGSTITVTKGTLIADIEGDVTGDVTGNLTGNVTGQTSDISNHDTDDLSEGSTNLYYTAARDTAQFNTDFAAKTTSDLTEGTNLYYTTTRANTDFDTRLATKSTTNLSEGTNLYYTAARDTAQFNTDLATKSTTNLSEGTNLYYTAARDTAQFNTDLATKSTTNLSEGTNLYFTDARADARVNLQTGANLDLSSKDTDDLSEGTTNLYYTDTRSRAAISASGSLTYDNSTGAITYTQGNTDTVAEGSTNQYFTQARARTSISASGDISYDNTTGVISFTAATAPVTSVNGSTGAVSLGLADLNNVDSTTPTDGQVLTWDNANSYWEPAAAAETGVTSVTASTGLTGGTITGTGTIGIDSTVATLTGAQALSNKTGLISQWTNDSNYSTTTGTVTSVDSGTGLTGGPITGTGTLNVDVGTTANKIVQLDGSAKLPAVDGSLLTGLPAGYDDADVDAHLNTGTASSSEVLSWTGTDYDWVTAGAGDVTLTGTQTLTNKTLTNPTIYQITGDNSSGTYSGDTLQLNTNYSGWSSGATGPAENWNGAVKITNWQDPGNGDKINVTQFATPEGKNFYRMDAFNGDAVSGTGVITDRSVTAGSFITGKKYKITSVGTTTQAQWETAGLSSTLTAAADMVFTATSAGVGTGTADAWDTGAHKVNFGLKGGDDIGFKNASDGFVTGNKYRIFSVGTTDFTAIGSADNNVGTEFTATGAGSGTGVAVDMRPFIGEFNQFGSHTGSQNPPGWATNLQFNANKLRFKGTTGNGYVFPLEDGTANQQLTTDGAGQLTWAAPATGGTVTSVTASTGLTGGSITGSGTLAIDSTVTTLTGTQTLTNKTLTDPTLEKITTGTGTLIIETDYSNAAYSAYNGSLILENYSNSGNNQINIASFNTANNHEFFRFGASGTADDGSHDANFQLRGDTNTFASMEVAGNTEAPLYFDASEIKFHNQYSFPTADGTSNQVLQTDGAGNLSFATVSGGGGATDLNGLSDVTITSVANNDLLMYNSTASKWQNTNLGVSVTPTLTGDSSATSGNTYTLTVSNHATYDDPAYFVEVYTGSTLVVANSAVTDNLDGTLTFTSPATGTHEIRIRTQDFGDLQSEIATKALTTAAFGGNFRYWKMTGVTCSQGNWWMLANWRMYTATSQGGTAYPGNMTSNALPTPYVADTNNNYNASYHEWKAFDSNTTNTFYWAIGSTNGPADWITIDLGAAVDVKSMSITAGNGATYAPTGFALYGSATGAFSGEETLVYTASGLPSVAAQVTNIG